MTKKGRGPKPNRGRRDTDKSEIFSHIGSSLAGLNSKKTRTHHARTVHLDSGNSSSGLPQLAKGKKEAIVIQKTNLSHSEPCHFFESGPIGGTKMADHEDHVEGLVRIN